MTGHVQRSLVGKSNSRGSQQGSFTTCSTTTVPLFEQLGVGFSSRIVIRSPPPGVSAEGAGRGFGKTGCRLQNSTSATIAAAALTCTINTEIWKLLQRELQMQTQRAACDLTCP